MVTARYILKGMRVVRRNWPLVAIAFLFKFGLALLFLTPLQSLVARAFGNHPAAGRLLEEWDLTPLIDFAYNNRTHLEQYGYFVLIAAIITIVLHLFLSGGLFRTIAFGLGQEQAAFTAEQFLGWCGRYFGRFFKIGAASVIFYVAIGALFIILSQLGERLILAEGAQGPVKVYAALGRMAGLLLLLLLVNMWMVYTKIVAVVHEERRLSVILGEALRFLRLTFWRAVSLYAGLLIGLLIIMGAYWALQKGCGVLPTSWTIVVLFSVQQALSLTRSWYRLVGYAAQTGLYFAKLKIER
ncbi:MAG: hypothetical protein ACE5OR_01270 [bacterium]